MGGVAGVEVATVAACGSISLGHYIAFSIMESEVNTTSMFQKNPSFNSTPTGFPSNLWYKSDISQ